MATPWQFLALALGGWVNRQQQAVVDYLKAENQLLRKKLGRKGVRFDDSERKHLARKGRAVGRKGLFEIGPVVHPDTILRWYRQLIARKYDGSHRRGPGRPGVMKSIRDLVIRMAAENTSWGYTRIQGALENVGHRVGRTTIQRILKKEGIEPAPTRKKEMSWRTFLEAHMGHIFAMDFFTVEALTMVGLVRYYVLVAINIKTREVHLCGIVHQPHEEWMKQIARNLTDAMDGFLLDAKYLTIDRDPLFCKAFRDILGDVGVNVVRLPARSPNLNAHIERFVLSIKSECLDRMVILGEAHLRHATREYLRHYHRERNHQALGNRLLLPMESDEGWPIQRRKRLGGILSFYHRKAA